MPPFEKWTSLGASASPAEDDAFATFRNLLPDDGITRAWANLTFLERNGRSGEIDVLLLSPVGFFVLEFKGWHGTIEGDHQQWKHRLNDHSKPRVAENPYILANNKAKRLASFLKDQAPSNLRSAVPFVQAAIVLHGRSSIIDLDEIAAQHVLALDGYNQEVYGEVRDVSEFLATPPANPNHQITAAHATRIAALIKHAGFRATPKTRVIGDYHLDDGEPLQRTDHWQDFLGRHPSFREDVRRIRVFDLPAGASRQDQERLESLARREYQLTRHIDHPSIEKATSYVTTDNGPALVFEYDPDAVSLDEHLSSRDLSFDERFLLVRNLAEVIEYAHGRRIMHRALTPSRVYVSEQDGMLRVRIRDWFTGHREPGTAQSSLTAISVGVEDVTRNVRERDWPYLAPESIRDGEASPPIPLDVYGLGMLSYFIFTGVPPLKNVSELVARTNDARSLDPTAIVPGLPEGIAALITRSTSVNELDRPTSVAAFLEALDLAITVPRPDDDAAPPVTFHVTDPLDAGQGDEIGDRFIVRSRRGQGSTGTALYVDEKGSGGHEGVVLKLARDDAAAKRLDVEARILGALDHPRIVQLIEGPFTLDGRRAILLSDAGRHTLADRLASDGRATIGQLTTFGTDLLEAVAYLESLGVFHRDIKPTNLGDAPDRSTRQPRLTLFDFSLSAELLEHTASGTTGYLDPFLGRGRRRQYDRAAELYATSVTLFAMARGELPQWRDGDSAPAGMDDRVVVDPSMFDQAIGRQLTAFFAKALHPDAVQRYSNAADLGSAWTAIFAELDRTTEVESNQTELDRLAAAAQTTTPLASAGLSPHALSALAAREDVRTVGELISLPSTKINAIPGLGERYRREIAGRIREWRARLLTHVEVTTLERPGLRSVEHIRDQLIPRPTPSNQVEVAALNAALGVTPAPSPWPSTAELSTLIGASRDDVQRALDNAVRRWAKSSYLTQPSEQLLDSIAAGQGLISLEDAVNAVVFSLASALEGDERRRAGIGIVRAVVEADARRQEPRIATRRIENGDGLVTVLLSLTDADGMLSGEDALDLAVALGGTADALVSSQSLVSRDRAVEELWARARHAGLEAAGLSDDDVLRIASLGATRAALSSRGELYPRDLPGPEAVTLAIRGSNPRVMTEQRARERVRARFPKVTQLPAMPTFGQLVLDAAPALRWTGSHFEQAVPATLPSITSQTVIDPHAADEAQANRTLRQSLERHSALTLAVSPHRYLATAAALSSRYSVQVLDVAELVVAALREGARENNAAWDAVTALDAKPEHAAILATLARQKVPPRWDNALSTPDPLLIVNAGPLGRYGLTDLLASTFDLSNPRPAARWLLATRRPSDPAPSLDGVAIPFGADGWLDLPLALTERDAS